MILERRSGALHCEVGAGRVCIYVYAGIVKTTEVAQRDKKKDQATHRKDKITLKLHRRVCSDVSRSKIQEEEDGKQMMRGGR